MPSNTATANIKFLLVKCKLINGEFLVWNVRNRYSSPVFTSGLCDMFTSSELISSVNLVKFHNLTAQSKPPDTSTLPHRLNAKQWMVLLCPVSSATKCPCDKSQIRTVQSEPAEAKNRPQTLKAKAWIVCLWPVIKRTWLPVVMSHKQTRRSLDPVAM